jgi:hypothetical protein
MRKHTPMKKRKNDLKKHVSKMRAPKKKKPYLSYYSSKKKKKKIICLIVNYH